MAYATVSVQVDLDEFDTEDLVDELERRGRPVPEAIDKDALERIFAALKTGRDVDALAITRAMIQNYKGCALL